MEDVICSCGTTNSYDNEVCSKCGGGLKGTCSTCNRQENITFVEERVCMWSVLEDCDNISEAFEIRLGSILWRYSLMIIGALAFASLISAIVVYFTPPEFKFAGSIISGGLTLFILIYFVFSWRLKKVYGFRQTLIQNYKKNHPTEAELLEKVGWKILP